MYYICANFSNLCSINRNLFSLSLSISIKTKKKKPLKRVRLPNQYRNITKKAHTQFSIWFNSWIWPFNQNKTTQNALRSIFFFCIKPCKPRIFKVMRQISRLQSICSEIAELQICDTFFGKHSTSLSLFCINSSHVYKFNMFFFCTVGWHYALFATDMKYCAPKIASYTKHTHCWWVHNLRAAQPLPEGI